MERELRVLLIEDDAAIAEMYQYRLEVDGYKVEVAPDGETGLQRATTDPPDLVYLDLRLPHMDGFEVLEGMRANPVTAGVPVIILTNYGEPELVQRGKELGVLDYLIKAETSPMALARRMQEWLGAEAIGGRRRPA